MDWRRGIIAAAAAAAALAAGGCREEAADREAVLPEGTPPPIAAVQALLLRQRLYGGAVDGVESEATAAAIRRYQILHGMRATGKLDARTLHAMLGPVPPLPAALAASDRAILRELAETPLPEPVAERREAIPALPPPPVVKPSPTPRKGSASKQGRSRPVRHYRSAPVE